MSGRKAREARQRNAFFAQRDRLYDEFRRREPKYRMQCMGLAPMGVDAWLAYFDALDATRTGPHNPARTHPQISSASKDVAGKIAPPESLP